MNEKIYAVWLQCCCGIASPLIKKLINTYGGIENIFKEREYSGFDTSKPAFDALMKKDVGEAERIVRLCRARGIRIITCEDGDFPRGLLSLRKMPACIYCVGRHELLSNISAAIVGSREASEIGRRSAYNLAEALSQNGITVISGMARGIDAAAHTGALKGKGGTVAVFGTAIDRPYPKDNIPLYEKIVENGCAISEIPPGEQVSKWNFAERNRLISGIADIIMVGESRSGSGALITAKYAGEQGKQVVCLPVLPNDGFAGTISLAESGAHVLTSLKDALELFERDMPRRTADSKTRTEIPRRIRLGDARHTAPPEPKRELYKPVEIESSDAARTEPSLSDRILDTLDGQEALSVNQMIRILQVDSGSIMVEVTLLELSGRIKRLPGDRYKINK